MNRVNDLELDYTEIDELKSKVEELIVKVNEIVDWINAQS